MNNLNLETKAANVSKATIAKIKQKYILIF